MEKIPLTIRALSEDEYSSVSGEGELKGNVSLGVFSDGVLFSVGQFGYPLDEVRASLYSAEFYGLKLLSGLPLKGMLWRLTEHYILDYKPSDLFVSANLGRNLLSDYRDSAEGLDRDFKKVKNGYEWVDPNRTYYTYKITASDSDKYYYGVSHVKKAKATLEDCLNDGYYGSGGGSPSNKYRRWKAKHSSLLVKEVIELFGRKSQAYESEKVLIGELWATDHFCLNSVAGGRRGSPPSPGAFHSQVTFQLCSEHGEVKHVFGVCARCRNRAYYREKNCSAHGKTIFWKDTCRKCMAEESFQEGHCGVHGFSVHHGKTCVKCSSSKRFKNDFCEDHGDTLFLGKSCHKCMTQELITEAFCPDHGLTKFRGESCSKCSLKLRDERGICLKHGDRFFRGGKCMSCIVSDSFDLLSCSVHGVSSFIGGKCKKCSGEASVTERECSIHGKVKHKGGSCAKCSISARDSLRVCDIHGASQHSGSKCRNCSGELGAHRRFHKAKSPLCRFCKS